MSIKSIKDEYHITKGFPEDQSKIIELLEKILEALGGAP